MSIKGACVDRTYQTDKHGNVTHWAIRGEDGNKYFVKSFIDKPYIFARIKGTPIHKDIEEISKEDYVSQCGEPLKKITVKKPKSVSGYKEYDKNTKMRIQVDPVKDEIHFVKTFEDNIEFPDRCAVDHGIKYGMWATSTEVVADSMIGGYECNVMPYIMTLDTEVMTYRYNPETKVEEPYVDFPDVTNPVNEIISLQCLDHQNEEIYFFRLHNDFDAVRNYKIGTLEYDRLEKLVYEMPFELKEKYKRKLKGRDSFVVHEHVFMSERSMLMFFIRFWKIKQYDIVVAFNGMDFDFPYVLNRMQFLKLPISELSPLKYVVKRIKGTKYNGEYVDETDIKIFGCQILDSMELFKKKLKEKRVKNTLGSFSLDYIEVDKVPKIQIDMNRTHSIDYGFFEDLNWFKKYACWDVILDYYVQKSLAVWSHYIKLTKISGVQIQHVTQPRKRLRQRTLFYAKQLGFVAEAETYGGSKKFEGATVIRPNFVGKLEMAADLDLTSQYPSMIQAWNISWDTLIIDHTVLQFSGSDGTDWSHIMDIKEAREKNIPYCIHPTEGVYFRIDKIGLYPLIITDTRDVRDKVRRDLALLTDASIQLRKGFTFDTFEDVYKDGKLVATKKQLQDILTSIRYNKGASFEFNDDYIETIKEEWDNDQAVLKIDINSIYGNLPPFLAACVTAAARTTIKFTRSIITKLKYPPSYTDTDSVIFKTRVKDVEKADVLTQWLVKKINDGYRKLEKLYNCIEGYLEIKSEEIYNPIIFINKKSSSKNEAASKVYVKTLVADRGKILAQPKLSHKGLLKKQKISKFTIDMGHMLIYYCGMNYSAAQIEVRVKALKKKFITGSAELNIAQEELDDMKNKRLPISDQPYGIEDIAFPLNIKKSWSEYKITDYSKKGVLNTNKYMHTWTQVVRYYNRGDTAFMVFVKPSSVPKDMKPVYHSIDKKITTTVWALDREGQLHPDFEIDYMPHFYRTIETYKMLLKAVGVDASKFLRDPKQNTLNLIEGDV